MEKCKVFNECSGEYSAQWPHKEAYSGGKYKGGKMVKISSNAREMNHMAPQATSATKNKKGEIMLKLVRVILRLQHLLRMATMM